jgi:hypothetical protein
MYDDDDDDMVQSDWMDGEIVQYEWENSQVNVYVYMGGRERDWSENEEWDLGEGTRLKLKKLPSSTEEKVWHATEGRERGPN